MPQRKWPNCDECKFTCDRCSAYTPEEYVINALDAAIKDCGVYLEDEVEVYEPEDIDE